MQVNSFDLIIVGTGKESSAIPLRISFSTLELIEIYGLYNYNSISVLHMTFSLSPICSNVG